MRSRSVVAIVLGSFLGLVGSASAQPAAASFPPSFHTLDRMDGRSLVGADLSYTSMDGGSIQRLGLYGQGVTEMGLGAYGAIAMANVTPDSGDGVTGQNNLEVGGIFALRNLLTFRLGLVLPTSSNDGAAAGFFGGFGRLTDLVQNSHEYTWLRLSASPILRSGTLFLRADLGVDIPVSKPSGASGDAILRGNLGVGWDGGVIVVTGELVNWSSTDSDASLARRTYSTFAAGARLVLGEWQPSLALVVPLDSDVRDDLNVIVMAGLQYVVF